LLAPARENPELNANKYGPAGSGPARKTRKTWFIQAKSMPWKILNYSNGYMVNDDAEMSFIITLAVAEMSPGFLAEAQL
jgi:hypothetical protein